MKSFLILGSPSDPHAHYVGWALHTAGYRAAFSFYGGVNLPRRINPYDVRRMRLVHYELTNPLWRLRLASSAVLGRSLM